MSCMVASLLKAIIDDQNLYAWLDFVVALSAASLSQCINLIHTETAEADGKLEDRLEL